VRMSDGRAPGRDWRHGIQQSVRSIACVRPAIVPVQSTRQL